MTSIHKNLQRSQEFIGRHDELRAIQSILTDETCRILTLVGVGGVGKTELALQTLDNLRTQFADGVYIVLLQSVQTEEGLISAIADALLMNLAGQSPPLNQLEQFLATKDTLVLLDNFEQLVEFSDLLSQLVSNAPGLKFLLTSREALRIQGEHLFSVEGLSLPASYDVDQITKYESAQLFLSHAKRIDRDFSEDKERAGVIRICQLVGGMPLAIEIAASWLPVLRCSEIASEIQKSVNFLQTNFRNANQRHESIKAVFNQTWQRLSASEQDAFKKLSVFRGGFDRTAAEKVAGASLQTLSSLIEKSLIRRHQTGRFNFHELLRQYAESELSEDEKYSIAMKHCDYFSNFLFVRRIAFNEGHQLETCNETELNLENIRAAIDFSAEIESIENLEKVAGPFFYYCQMRSRFLESVKVSEKIIDVLAKAGRHRMVAQTQVYLGWMLLRIGRIDDADRLLESSTTSFYEHNYIPQHGMGSHPLAPHAIIKSIRGEYDLAIEMGKHLKDLSQASEDLHNLSFAYYALTSAYLNMGEYELANQHGRQAVRLAERCDNFWFKAYCLNEWSKVAIALRDYEEAQSHYRESLRIREQFNDPEGVAVVSAQLGEIAFIQNQYADAIELYERSLSIYQKLNDKGGLATVKWGMGKIAIAKSQFLDASIFLLEALNIAFDIEFIPLVLSIMIDIADLMIQNQKEQVASRIVATVGTHTAVNAQHQNRLNDVRKRISINIDDMDSSDFETLYGIVKTALEDFVPVPTANVLVDPLTPRELEILKLINVGMSNPQIGEHLFISTGTVKAHSSSIYSKLAVSNRTEAVSKARYLGIIE